MALLQSEMAMQPNVFLLYSKGRAPSALCKGLAAKANRLAFKASGLAAKANGLATKSKLTSFGFKWNGLAAK